MKKLAIIRYGTDTPLQKEKPIITKIAGEHIDCAMFASIQGIGIISFVYTQFSAEQIVAEFKTVAEETDDTLPVMVFDLDSAAFDLSWVENFEIILSRFNQEVGAIRGSIKMGLDELLDRANKLGGVNRLTQEEFELLKKLSQ